MVTLAFLMAACLDPVQAALVLAIVVAYRGPLPTVIAGAAGALIAETAMALLAAGYVWGELFAPRLVAALLQAVVAVLAVWTVRSAARGAWATLAADDRLATTADGGIATLHAPEARPESRHDSRPNSHMVPPRLTLWHMRAYARLRTVRLHRKKNAALDCESQ